MFWYLTRCFRGWGLFFMGLKIQMYTILHAYVKITSRTDLKGWDDLSRSSGGFAILSMEIGIRLCVCYYGVVIFGRIHTPKSHYPSSGRSLVQQLQFLFWQHVKFRFWQLLVVWISVLCLLHVSLIWCSTLCFFLGRSYFWTLLFWFDFCWQETGLICWLLPVRMFNVVPLYLMILHNVRFSSGFDLAPQIVYYGFLWRDF